MLYSLCLGVGGGILALFYGGDVEGSGLREFT